MANYFFFVAEEVRQLMAKLGFRRLNDMIGRLDVLDARQAVEHWKAKGLDFSRILYQPPVRPGVAIYNQEAQDHRLEKVLNHQLIAQARATLERQELVQIEISVHNN
ncbi:MAG: hypothetical protein ACU4EQ_01115 [Candidatus Nitrosoglobus sp.]